MESLTKMEQSGKLRIITFAASRLRNEDNPIAAELAGLTEDLGECHLLLDFTNVEFITSIELATLVNLHKKMKEANGGLTLFNLNPQIFEVFAITRLEKLIAICR